MTDVGQRTPCGGCGEDVGGVHKCPVCDVSMHIWCGAPQGQEGFGQRVLCPRCEGDVMSTDIEAASPLIAAFDRARYVNDERTQHDVDALEVRAQHDVDAVEVSVSDSDSTADTIGVTARPAKRARQVVNTVHDRRRVVVWMKRQGDHSSSDSKSLFVMAVDAFPNVFGGDSREANLRKARRWWDQRDKLIELPRGSLTVSNVTSSGRQTIRAKALEGRGRKPSAWVQWIYPELLSEFSRLRKAGLQFDMPLLRQLAITALRTSTHEKFNKLSVDDKGVLLIDRITTRWTQSFMEKHNIVSRAQTGKKQVSVAKTQAIRALVATHLGELKRGFESKDLNQDTIENIDETHFVIDFDTGKTLGFVGETSIKYADVVSGGEGMTMVVRLTGGKSARVMPPMMIFTNENGSYPIRGVADDVGGVSYRSGKKGWMDRRVFREYLGERRAIWGDLQGRVKTLYIDNCSGHLSGEECTDELSKLNARIRFLPANATDLCQPADSFVIAKLKDIWSRKWNEKKLELIESSEWQDKARKDGSWSGKLRNPGKEFFLKLAAESVQELNTKRDKNGLTFARKAMIRCGMSLDVNDCWHVGQLLPHLQEIIKEFPSEFDGLVGTPQQPSNSGCADA